MACPLLIQYSGAAYHTISQGHEKKALFRDDAAWVHAAGGGGFSRLALYIREQDHESEKGNAKKIDPTRVSLIQ